ncbi:hypothetical protein MC885_016276, partial [Smutsia gigantea]
MQLEIQVALNFIISYLYNKLPRRRVNIFGEELERLLKKKYEGHWYPEKPYKGSGFRCIHIGEKVDPVIEQASKESGLDIDDVRGNLPQDLSVWIDPFEVSYQIGEKGPVKVLYVDDNNENGLPATYQGVDPDPSLFLVSHHDAVDLIKAGVLYYPREFIIAVFRCRWPLCGSSHDVCPIAPKLYKEASPETVEPGGGKSHGHCKGKLVALEMFTQQTIHGLETCQLAWKSWQPERERERKKGEGEDKEEEEKKRNIF